jgi:hypothetical protein
MIFPAVIEEIDPAVDGLIHDGDRSRLVLRLADMVTAQRKSRDLDIGMTTKWSLRYYGSMRQSAGYPFDPSIEVVFH